MASGDTLFILKPHGSTPTSTNPATLDTIEDGAASDKSIIPVLDFDATTSEHAEWHLMMPSHYDSGGLTFKWHGGTSAANAGTLQLDFRCLVIADATTLTGDLDVDGQTAVSVSDTPAATANQLNYSTTGNLSHVNADSPSGGSSIIIRATRNVSDTNTGDLQLAAVYVTET